MQTKARFVLEVPPAKEYVRTARIFGASIARHFRCDEESVEDLKLALSEAVSRAFGGLAGASQGPVRLIAQASSERLSFRIESGDPRHRQATDASSDEWELSGDDLAGEIAEGLICALFPDATFLQAEEPAHIVQFSMPLKARGQASPSHDV